MRGGKAAARQGQKHGSGSGVGACSAPSRPCSAPSPSRLRLAPPLRSLASRLPTLRPRSAAHSCGGVFAPAAPPPSPLARAILVHMFYFFVRHFATSRRTFFHVGRGGRGRRGALLDTIRNISRISRRLRFLGGVPPPPPPCVCSLWFAAAPPPSAGFAAFVLSAHPRGRLLSKGKTVWFFGFLVKPLGFFAFVSGRVAARRGARGVCITLLEKCGKLQFSWSKENFVKISLELFSIIY